MIIKIFDKKKTRNLKVFSSNFRLTFVYKNQTHYHTLPWWLTETETDFTLSNCFMTKKWCVFVSLVFKLLKQYIFENDKCQQNNLDTIGQYA